MDRARSALWRAATAAALAAVEDAGVEVLRPDKTAFAARVETLYRRLDDDPELAALVARIRAVDAP